MQPGNQTASGVPATAKQGAETTGPRAWSWVEAAVWTDRMLAALENGVTGGKWYSLMDKVYAPRTLAAAWKRVAANRGAAGVDDVSVQRFTRQAPRYLAELAQELRDGTYQPEPVRRVYIPKGPGRTRPSRHCDGSFILHLHTGGFGITALLEQVNVVDFLMTLAPGSMTHKGFLREMVFLSLRYIYVVT